MPYHATATLDAVTASHIGPRAGTMRAAPQDCSERPPTNLPVVESSFVGRSHELQELHELACRHRLLTLVGLGGIGKTRLAQQFALDAIADYPDGAWFVSLKELDDASRLADTIACALDAYAPAGSTEARLYGRLRGVRTLLILDNAEHLREALASLVHHLLENAPTLTIVVTSREPLQIDDEHVFMLDGIDEGMRLFIERAYPDQGDPQLAPSTRKAILAICKRLNAIPLAIELAAANARTMHPEELVNQVEGFSAKHPALGQMLQWSYGLLDENEQRFLDAVSLFDGSFTWEAAAAISAPGNQDAVATLSSLVNKSFVARQRVAGSVDYYLLEVVRHYAEDRLRASADAAAYRRRYVNYYLSSMEQAAVDGNAAEILAKYWHNAQSALRYAIDEAIDIQRAPTAVSKLSRFFSETGRANEGLAWIERASACRVLSSDEALDVIDASSRLLSTANRVVELEPCAEHLVREREKAKGDDPKRYGDALFVLGNAKARLGKDDEAEDHYDQALAQYQKSGYRRGIAMVLGTLGIFIAQRAVSLERLLRAKELCQQSLRMFREDSLGLEEAQALENLGIVYTRLGELPQALAVTRKALELYREFGNPMSASIVHENIADVYLAMNRPVQALSELLAGRRLMTEIPRGPYCAYYAELAFKAAVDLGAYNAATQFYAFADEWRRLIQIPRPAGEQVAIDSRYILLAQSLAAPILEQLVRDGAALGLPDIDALVEHTIRTFTPSEEAIAGHQPTVAKTAADRARLFRTRLALRIDQALAHPVVFLNAGAAWGKTTAIEQYLRERGERAIWLTLDSDTVAVAQFTYQFRAVVEAEISPPTPLPPISNASSVDGQISQWLTGYSGTIVVDNLHVIQSDPRIASVLFDTMSRTKDRIRWFMLSREPQQDPYGSCTAYGLAGQPLDERDLAFSFEEAMEYGHTLNADVTREEMEAILTLTEGWPRAVAVALEEQIASIGIHSRQRIDRVTSRTLSRLVPFVRKKLYANLSPQDQRVLLIAGAMPGDVRIDVVRQLDATVQQRLATLSTKLGLRPTGNTYRFPPILRHCAASELAKSADRKEIAQTLADAFQRLGDAASAARVLLSLGAYEPAMRILAEHEHAWANGDWPELLAQGVSDLPVQFKLTNATALLAHAALLVRHNRVDQALQAIDTARVPTDEGTRLRVACGYATICLNHDRTVHSAPLEAALGGSSGDSPLHLRARALLCCVYIQEGRRELAQPMLAQLSEALAGLIPDERTIDILYWAAFAAYILGDYVSAKTLATRVVSGYERERWLAVAQAHDLLSRLAFQTAAPFNNIVTWNSAALNTAKTLNDSRHLTAYLKRRCVLLFYNGAVDLVDLAMNHPATVSTPLWNTYSTVFRFLTDIQRATEKQALEEATPFYGSALQAARLLDADEIFAGDPFIARACLMLTATLANDAAIRETIAKTFDDAEVALREARLSTEIRHACIARLSALLCQMVLGEFPPLAQLKPYLERQSEDIVVNAVTAIVRSSIYATYRSKKQTAPSMLEGAGVEASAELRTRGYGTVATLLDAIARKSAMLVAVGAALTPKEAEVLLLMAQGYSVVDIAEALSNSPSTIQTHQKKIFLKLGVNDKLAAINQGRALGLV